MIMQKLRGNNEGFTLIELMIVIAIIGILAAIAIPNFLAYRRRSYNSAANADCKNIYTAAQAYFSTSTWSSAELDIDKLKTESGGFKQSDNVVITIENGKMNSLLIKTSHDSGDKGYKVSSSGSISEWQ